MIERYWWVVCYDNVERGKRMKMGIGLLNMKGEFYDEFIVF